MENSFEVSSSEVHFSELGEEESICDESFGLVSLATFCRSQRYNLLDSLFLHWIMAGYEGGGD